MNRRLRDKKSRGRDFSCHDRLMVPTHAPSEWWLPMNHHPISEGRACESLISQTISGTRGLVPPRFMVPMPCVNRKAAAHEPAVRSAAFRPLQSSSPRPTPKQVEGEQQGVLVEVEKMFNGITDEP